MKITPAHSYSAVPFMFTVAPIGKTKLEMVFDTPAFFSTLLMVTGRVALEEQVEKAVNMAGVIALKCLIGLIFVDKKKIAGRTTNR